MEVRFLKESFVESFPSSYGSSPVSFHAIENLSGLEWLIIKLYRNVDRRHLRGYTVPPVKTTLHHSRESMVPFSPVIFSVEGAIFVVLLE